MRAITNDQSLRGRALTLQSEAGRGARECHQASVITVSYTTHNALITHKAFFFYPKNIRFLMSLCNELALASGVNDYLVG